jgi:hypothetical protein
MKGESDEMNESSSSGPERKFRAGERVNLDGRLGVVRYLYGTGAAVVRFDQDTTTRVVPVRRLRAVPDR